ncbi:MAG: hypothetical protein J4F34_02220 [Gemmatimonadetes bacterium]|nr:hypothetical protein [Gemmatimonadota bacterium]
MFIQNSARRLRLRVFASCALLAQAGVLAVVPSVEAQMEAERLLSPTHLELPEGPCSAQHSRQYCQLVRSLSSGHPTIDFPALEVPAFRAPVSSHPPPADLRAIGETFLIGAIVPRGPPPA